MRSLVGFENLEINILSFFCQRKYAVMRGICVESLTQAKALHAVMPLFKAKSGQSGECQVVTFHVGIETLRQLCP